MPNSRFSGAGARFTAVLGVHVLAIAAIAQMNPEMKRALAPIMVSFITPPEPKAQAPAPARQVPMPHSMPRPQVQRTAPVPVEPLPMTAPVTEPWPRATSIPMPQQSADPVQPAPALPAPLVAAPATPVLLPPAPVPVAAPRFDAAYLNNPAPAYPALSRRMGERGRVLLRVFVNADGATREVQIRTSSGSARLDQAAKDAVERWRFVPARQGDEAVGAWVLVPISFQLEG